MWTGTPTALIIGKAQDPWYILTGHLAIQANLSARACWIFTRKPGASLPYLHVMIARWKACFITVNLQHGEN